MAHAKAPKVNYDNFTKDDLINLVESKTNMISVYEQEMQDNQNRVNTLLKEKQDLTALNITLTNNFSTLEVFVSGILGQKAMKDVRDEDNNYDLDLIKQHFNKSSSDIQTLRENNENLMEKLEQAAVKEESFRQLKKKVDEWGGQQAIATAISKIKTLTLENEYKDKKIAELNERLSQDNENKGAELLQKLTTADEDGDKKSKSAMMIEISQKSNEILELKDKLNQAMQSLRATKGNPFEKAGGSDDEDNKERIVNRNSIENRVIPNHSLIYIGTRTP